MEWLSLTDLGERWCYTKAGIHKLSHQPHFPKPCALVSKGRLKIYALKDIQVYEKDKPWLFEEDAKIRRQRLFGLLHSAKENGEVEQVLEHIFGKKKRTL